MAILQQAGALVPFVFSTLAFAFVITTFVTRDWAHQHYYSPELSTTEWTTPAYTLYRSPFVVCNVTTTNPTPNTTENAVGCYRFKVYGRGKTSCESDAALGGIGFINNGDERMCEQVHFSGNLILASLVFATLGFAICLPLTGYAVLSTFKTKPSTETTQAETEGHHNHHHHEKQHPQPVKYPIYITIATYSLIVALSISAVATFLAQFYGIMGLIQSAPDNGIFASYVGGGPNLSGDTSHAPWSQGKGLSIFASLGWVFNAVAAGAVGGIWAVFLRRR